MKIALITQSGECAAIANWIAENGLSNMELERWTLEPPPDVAEQVLDALAAQWLLTPADILIFPAGPLGDELATRLAWRLHGGSLCQVQTLEAQQRLVNKSHWGKCADGNIARYRASLMYFSDARARIERVGKGSACDGGIPDCTYTCSRLAGERGKH